MTVLRESPWHSEILKEGIDLGIEQGIEQGERKGLLEAIERVLIHRFGKFPGDLQAAIAQLQSSISKHCAIRSSTLHRSMKSGIK